VHSESGHGEVYHAEGYECPEECEAPCIMDRVEVAWDAGIATVDNVGAAQEKIVYGVGNLALVARNRCG